jgi:alpha-beta hydrolase superfamily lysophospholipase
VRAPAHHRRAEAWLRGAGLRWARVRYPRPEAGGEVAAFRFLPARPARGRVVAAHGAANDALFPLVALYRALVEAGFEVFAFDLDGNGWESTTRFSPGGVRSAVGAAVRAATEGREEMPLHLLGHSLGGALVLDALARGQVAPEKAVILSAPLEVSTTLRTVLGELRGFFRRGTLGQCAYYGAWGVVPALGPLKRRAYPLRGEVGTATFGYVGAVRALLREMDLPAAAARVRSPVLLVYGEADFLVPPEQGEALARLLPAAELLRVPGASHYALPFAPGAVERVAGWLGRASDSETGIRN